MDALHESAAVDEITAPAILAGWHGVLVKVRFERGRISVRRRGRVLPATAPPEGVHEFQRVHIVTSVFGVPWANRIMLVGYPEEWGGVVIHVGQMQRFKRAIEACGFEVVRSRQLLFRTLPPGAR